jgi:murein DD-endopeptidase MepM/ murein hydrolase activator NlpD
MRKCYLPSFRKCSKIAVAVTCSLLLSFVPSNVVPTKATTIEEAQEERNEAEENKNDAQSVLDNLEEEQNKLISDVEELDSQISSIQTQITNKQAEADALNDEIDDTKVKLAEAQVAEDDQYAAMMKRIQYLYENGEVEYIDTLMSSASFSDMLNKSEYVEQLSDFDQKQLDGLVNTRETIQEYEDTLKADLKEVESVQADLENQEEQLQVVISEKNDRIAQYDQDIDAQSALVDKYQQEMDAADEKIAEIQRQQLAAQQAAAAAAAAAAGSSETTYYEPSYSGTFMWPAVSGSSISSSFGPRTSPTAGASSNHKGIDIPCPTGSDIVAGADGVVTISQYSSSAGYYIMIDHGNGVATVYMHNSQLIVGVGESVVRGQVIAKAGSTGYSTGSHCHFGVMINGSYVNPLNYLG